MTSACPIASRLIRRAALTAAPALLLGGCVLESPYWAQTFPSTTAQIPIQTWSAAAGASVQIHCAKAYHGGLVEPVSWTLVTTIAPGAQAAYDTAGGAIYGAGKKQVLPAACWNADNAYSPPKYMTALRARQTTASGTTTYRVFNLAGLECMGKWNGAMGSWFAWASRSCALTYSGSTTPLDYTRVIATSLGAMGAGAAPAEVQALAVPSARSAPAPAPDAAPDADRAAPGWQQRFEIDAPALGQPPERQALQQAWDRARPAGTTLLGLECRQTLCRAEVRHADEAARMRFVGAMAAQHGFPLDGIEGHVEHRREGAALRSVYYLVRQGRALAGAGEAAATR